MLPITPLYLYTAYGIQWQQPGRRVGTLLRRYVVCCLYMWHVVYSDLSIRSITYILTYHTHILTY
jgi:hypothetical protein